MDTMPRASEGSGEVSACMEGTWGVGVLSNVSLVSVRQDLHPLFPCPLWGGAGRIFGTLLSEDSVTDLSTRKSPREFRQDPSLRAEPLTNHRRSGHLSYLGSFQRANSPNRSPQLVLASTGQWVVLRVSGLSFSCPPPSCSHGSTLPSLTGTDLKADFSRPTSSSHMVGDSTLLPHRGHGHPGTDQEEK